MRGKIKRRSRAQAIAREYGKAREEGGRIAVGAEVGDKKGRKECESNLTCNARVIDYGEVL